MKKIALLLFPTLIFISAATAQVSGTINVTSSEVAGGDLGEPLVVGEAYPFSATASVSLHNHGATSQRVDFSGSATFSTGSINPSFAGTVNVPEITINPGMGWSGNIELSGDLIPANEGMNKIEMIVVVGDGADSYSGKGDVWVLVSSADAEVDEDDH